MYSTTLISFQDEFVRFIAGGRMTSQCTTRQKQAHLQILHMTTFELMKISNSSQDIKRRRITFEVFALPFQSSRTNQGDLISPRIIDIFKRSDWNRRINHVLCIGNECIPFLLDRQVDARTTNGRGKFCRCIGFRRDHFLILVEGVANDFDDETFERTTRRLDVSMCLMEKVLFLQVMTKLSF